MLEEPHILGGEHGLDEVARQHFERQQRAMPDDAPVAKRQLREMRAVGREHERRLVRVIAPRVEVGHVGQIARPAAQRERDRARGDDRRGEREPDRGEQRQSPPPATVAAIRDDDPHFFTFESNSDI
jgi:hypothetical protein